MTNASDTPRVDAASFKVIGPVPERAVSVPAEMARELERELAAKSTEVERLREALRNLLVMLPSVACDGEDKERIPAGFCYVRWQDIREAHEALEAK